MATITISWGCVTRARTIPMVAIIILWNFASRTRATPLATITILWLRLFCLYFAGSVSIVLKPRKTLEATITISYGCVSASLVPR